MRQYTLIMFPLIELAWESRSQSETVLEILLAQNFDIPLSAYSGEGVPDFGRTIIEPL